MKNLFLLLLFLPIASFSQSVEEQYIQLYLPWTEGKLIYSEVVEAPDKTSEELYTQSRIWFSDNFNSGKTVLDIDDKEIGVLSGKAWSQIYLTVIGMPVGYQLWYRVMIEVKDGKYRYQIKDLEFENQDKQYGTMVSSAEEQFQIETMFKDNGKLKSLSKSYYDQMIIVVEGLETSLKNDLLKKSLKEDW